MSSIINMPESVEIAIYGLIVIGNETTGAKANVEGIAERINASSNHIHKVLRQLAKNGFIKSKKGPGGGYVLNRDPSQISLLDIYETLEGPVTESGCPLGRVKCPFNACVYDSLFTEMNRKFKNYFKNKKISDFIGGRYGNRDE